MRRFSDFEKVCKSHSQHSQGRIQHKAVNVDILLLPLMHKRQ